jgi:hypothetical protein
MSVSEADIDRVVREVLRRLAAMTPSPLEPAAAATTVSLTTRVVTMAELKRKLDGVQRVEVPYRAVVTPAARDYLRERGVQLVYAAAPATKT